MKDHSVSVGQARCATYIVAKYLDTATVKASTTFYNTTLPSDMIFTKYLISDSPTLPNQWLLLPLHHLCGFLACYGVIDVCWCFNGRFTYYLNHLAPLCAALRRSRVAQCHQGVVGWVPKPSYSLLS